ncbi:MAG: hypothetical protein DIU61_002725 [Bacteroidota bacterium]|jgi:hypothetical protein|nr:MAG: hypothetical protein DIU61_08375 [Bacteroidota bacterium]
MKSLSLILLLFSAFIAGCTDESSERRVCEGSDVPYPLVVNDILEIEYGTSFGMCVGYCITWIEASQDKILYTKAGSQDVTPVSCSGPTPCQGWSAKWENLVSDIDIEAFFNLDEVIGCPDCADGGAEWVEITTFQGKHKVTYEYTAPPDAIKPFRDTLFELKESFKCD